VDLPVIFLTAKAMPGEVERLMGLGALGVIVKPFDPVALADEVMALLAGWEARMLRAA
jgi:CheY-like chemotaxis protein